MIIVIDSVFFYMFAFALMRDSSTDFNNKKAPHYLSLMARMFAFSLVVLLSTKLVMLWFYASYFANISFFETLYALVYGVRFDSATMVILGSIFWLLLLIPLPGFQHPRVRQTWAWLYFLLLCVVFILCLGDVYYFGEVDRHTGRELLNIGNDIGALVVIALEGAPLFTAFAFALLAILAFIWWRWVIIVAGQKPRLPKGIVRKVLVVLLVLLLAVFLGRGMVLKSRPIAVVDAFSLPSPESANLALNGVFVLMKEVSRPDRKPLNLLTQAHFHRLNQAYLKSQKTQPETDVFASRFNWQATKYKSSTTQSVPKNVVVVLLESWSYQFIDGLSGSDYGATPFMDALIKKSQVWERFYAAGQRSIYGLQAVLSSIPVMDNYPSLGFGLEVNRMSELGSIATQQGYSSIFVQTSERRSFHVDGITSRLGFQQYYGKEDIPIIKDYPQTTPHFGWDYDGLMLLHSKIDDSVKAQPNKHFLAMIFTGTTHIPYPDPGAEFHIRKHSTKTKSGYLNTLRYSDWALEQFMNAAKQSPWYEDTVFIFFADHTLRAGNKDLATQFHIPLVVFAPDGSLPPKRHKGIASQYDILPTLVDLMQSPQRVSAFGRSLFDDESTRMPYALVSKGSLYGVIHKQGWATFSGQKNIQEKLSKGFSLEQANRLRDHARWSLQHTDGALNNNSWAPNQSSSH